MSDTKAVMPNSSAVRVALWRALHAQFDAPPHVIEDEVGLRLASPGEGWHNRPDMNPDATKFFRASIVARARFIEDLVVEQSAKGLQQYFILGAGLDTFAQRRPDIASRMRVFEVDQPEHQAWKRQRLIELGYGIPEWLKLVPVDFEAGEDWLQQLTSADFRTNQPAVVASTGVSMYLTKEAIAATMRQVAGLAPGSTLVMTFLVPLHFMDSELRPAFEMAEKGAHASGTPFLSFFMPEEIIEMALQTGFSKAQHVSGADLAQSYFANRPDGLRPPNHAEDLLVATV